MISCIETMNIQAYIIVVVAVVTITMIIITACLSRCATSWKVAGSNPDEITRFFFFALCFQPHYGRGVDSASDRNEY
jgi:hypothetical protein